MVHPGLVHPPADILMLQQSLCAMLSARLVRLSHLLWHRSLHCPWLSPAMTSCHTICHARQATIDNAIGIDHVCKLRGECKAVRCASNGGAAADVRLAHVHALPQ
jgi:hypothetical protein